MKMQEFILKTGVLTCVCLVAVTGGVYAADDAPRFIPGTPILAPKDSAKEQPQKKSRITVSAPTAPTVPEAQGVLKVEPVPAVGMSPKPKSFGGGGEGLPSWVAVDENGQPKKLESFEEVERGIQQSFNPPADPATLAEIKKSWEKARELQNLQKIPPVEAPFVSLLGHKTMSEKLAVVVPDDMFEGAQSRNDTEDGITEIVYPGKGEKSGDARNSLTVLGYRDGMKAGLSTDTVLKELNKKYQTNCYSAPVVRNYGPVPGKNFGGASLFAIGCPATRNGDEDAGVNPGDGQAALVMNIPGKQDMFVVRWNKRFPKGSQQEKDLFTDQDIQKFLTGMRGISVQPKGLIPDSSPGFSLQSTPSSSRSMMNGASGGYITPPPTVR